MSRVEDHHRGGGRSTGPAEPRAPGARGRGRWAGKVGGAVVQIGGFLVGIALLAWCVRRAMTPENREAVENLRHAPPLLVAAIVGLAALSLLINGAAFRTVLAPVRRLRWRGVIAVNALATVLNYLPFKLSVIARVAIHNRRDGVPLLTIGAWMGAVGVTVALGIGPLVAATLWAGGIGPAWFGVAGGLLVGGLGAVHAVARMLGGDAGLERIHAIADATRLGLVGGLIRSRFFAEAHTGFTMLSSLRHSVAAVGLRLLDAAAVTARFLVAANIAGVALAPADAVVLAVAYFAIGVVSPVGMTGFREAGTTGLAGLLAMADANTFAVVALVVGGAELLANVAGGGIALAWLRPGRGIFTAESGRAQRGAGRAVEPRMDADGRGSDPATDQHG